VPTASLCFGIALLFSCSLLLRVAEAGPCLQGYFYKAGAMKEQKWVTIPDTAEVVVRAQVAQTLGLRLLFFFPVSVRS
jgi:hypothetical protein